MTFDINDLNALREEYEERIGKLKQEHAEQLAADRKLRQEFIQELTLELADAREEGETRVMDAEKRRAIAEAELHIARSQHKEALAQLRDIVARSEAELATIRAHLDALLAPPEPAPAEHDASAQVIESAPAPSASAQVIDSAPAPSLSTPPSPIGKAERRRRIRLR